MYAAVPTATLVTLKMFILQRHSTIYEVIKWLAVERKTGRNKAIMEIHILNREYFAEQIN